MGSKALRAWAVPALVLTLACASISLFYGGTTAFLAMVLLGGVSALVLYRRTRAASNNRRASSAPDTLSMSEKVSRLRDRMRSAEWRHYGLTLLAGFLRKLVVTPELDGRILNIHPALLPDSAAAGQGFYGERVHASVIASGATISGATVHVVDNDYDTGPIVLRSTVPVLPGDTPESLAARVFEAECLLYPAAVRHHIANRQDLFGG